MTALPTAADVVAAASLLRPFVRRTPVLESAALNRALGAGRRVLVKAECLQVTGSFKFRGALHRLMHLEALELPCLRPWLDPEAAHEQIPKHLRPTLATVGRVLWIGTSPPASDLAVV